MRSLKKEVLIKNYLQNLLNSPYQDLQKKKIYFEIVKGKGFFMQTLILSKLYHYFFGYRIEIHKSVFKMPHKAIIGCLAHELEHISFNERSFFNYLKHDERIIDFNVIKKGLGAELLELIKYHDSIYKKYKKKDGLTRKEIKSFIK